MANTQIIQDYIRQLKRHTKGRQAVVLKLSALEKPFQESHYRMTMASCMKPIAKRFEGEFFALPNRDGLLIIKDATLDIVDTAINSVREALKASVLIKNLDPIQGKSDDFCDWYSLESSYPTFLQAIEDILAGRTVRDTPLAPPPTIQGKKSAPTPASKDQPSSMTMRKGQRMVVIQPPEKKTTQRPLDVATLAQLDKTINTVDLEPFMKTQWVKAIIGNNQSMPVMLHRFVPMKEVVTSLVPNLDFAVDRFLAGYIKSLLDARFMQNCPQMTAKDAPLCSIRLTLDSISTPSFQTFDASMNGINKNNVVIELAMLDCAHDHSFFLEVLSYLQEKGYRTAIGGIDLHTFLWFNFEAMKVDFVKLACHDPNADYLEDAAFIMKVKAHVKQQEAARLILDGCDTQAVLAFGQKCGISIFQGDLVAPVNSGL